MNRMSFGKVPIHIRKYSDQLLRKPQGVVHNEVKTYFGFCCNTANLSTILAEKVVCMNRDQE